MKDKCPAIRIKQRYYKITDYIDLLIISAYSYAIAEGAGQWGLVKNV